VGNGGPNTIRASNIAGSVVIANNALYAAGGNAIRVDGYLSAVTVSGNRGDGSTQGVVSRFDDGGSLATDLVPASYSGELPQNVFPSAGSGLTGTADPQFRLENDFNLRRREETDDIGAYRTDRGINPGWPLGTDFKPSRWIFEDDFELGSTADWSGSGP